MSCRSAGPNREAQRAALHNVKSGHGWGHSDRRQKKVYKRRHRRARRIGGRGMMRCRRGEMREEDRSTKEGREHADAWNPVISATKRAVHLTGARWHVSAVVTMEGY